MKTCDFVECWHYGTCYSSINDEIEGIRINNINPPEISEETKKPRCFLDKSYFRSSKKKSYSADDEESLDDLKKARKEARRRKKEE